MATNRDTFIDTDVPGGLGDGSSLANAYSSMNTAEAATINWVTTDQVGYYWHYATAGTADTTATTWAGHTTNATHPIYLLPGTGQEHAGVWSTSIYRMSVTNASCLSFQTGFIYLIGLLLESNFTVADYYSVLTLTYLGAPSTNAIGNCIIRTTGGGHLNCMAVSHANMTMYVYCCILGPATNRGIYCNVGNLYVDNATIYGCSGNGINASATCSLLSVINTAIGLTSDDINSSATTTVIDYCCTDDGDGTHDQTPAGGDWSTVFTDVAARDFSLKTTGVCYQTGVADPRSGLYSTDAVGTAFGVLWDIGARSSYSVPSFIPESSSSPFYIQQTAAGEGAIGRKVVYGIIWHAITSAAHTLQVKDGNGTVIIPETAAGSTRIRKFNFTENPLYLDGIETDIIGSGGVIYLLR